MTSECQFLDISVNKLFKDSINYKFELNSINLEKLNGKIRLKAARLNIRENIYSSGKDDNLIIKDVIINGFQHTSLLLIII